MTLRYLDSRWAGLLLMILTLCAPASAESVSQSLGVLLSEPNVQGTLLVLGTIFLVLSLVTLGSGVAEVLCFSSFLLLFVGRYSQGEDMLMPLALLVLGVLFAALEIFVMPGFGVFGLLSALSFAGLSIQVMESTKGGVLVFLLSSVLSVGFVLAAMRMVPHLCTTRKLFVLEPPKSDLDPLESVPLPNVQVGEIGQAATTLRPTGAALFGKERLEVISEGEFVAKGAYVEVLQVEAGRIRVRSCPPPNEIASS